jgi:lipopolysaccharide biosynthesis regulator YciM
MYKIVLILVVSLFFVACSNKSEPLPAQNVKAFDAEDAYILFALHAEEIRDYESASKLFSELYKRSNKKEYLYKYLKNLILLKQNNLVVKKVDTEIEKNGYDPKLVRLKIVALLGDAKIEEAKDVSISLAKNTKDVDDYILVSDIYVALKEYDLALKYLQGAYVKEYNEKILDKMSIVMYVNLDRKKDAIAELETYTRMMGCSELICNRLIGFYSKENNLDGLLSTYLRFYESTKNEEVAKKIIQIYTYTKQYVKLMDFLESSGVDNDLLLDLYTSAKNYKKAYELANKLYKESGEVSYLAQSAIYEYESYGENITIDKVKNTVNKLEDVIKIDRSALYLNYLGYILIDHDIDVKKGMSYIKEVVKSHKNSIYYLDSLAWGYYKLHQCYKAKEIMNKIESLGSDKEQEVLEHMEAIDKCLKKRKGKR